MSDISQPAMLGHSERPAFSFGELLCSPLALTIFLALANASLFFFAEQDLKISKNLNFVEDIENQESWADGGNKIRQLSFLAVAAIGTLSLLFGRAGKFRMNLPVFLIACYVIWAGISVVWSIDSGTTMRRYLVLMCSVIGCFGFARFMRVEDVVLSAVIVSMIYLILGVGAEVAFGRFLPHTGEHRFAGTMHPNIQAANLAMGCLAAFTMAKIKPKAQVLYYSIFAVLFVFLVMTKCRSGTLVVPVALGVIWLASQPTRNIFIGMLAAFWLVSTIGFLCMVTGFDPIAEYQEVLLLGRGEETGTSLTGRLPLWEDLSEYIANKPFQGHGYKAFWTPRHITDIAASQEWTISEAHSSYIGATLQLGVIGMLLMAVSAISTLFYSAIRFRITMQPAYLFLVGGSFFCIVRGFTESGLDGPGAVTAPLFLAIAAHSWNGQQKLIDTDESVNDDPISRS